MQPVASGAWSATGQPSHKARTKRNVLEGGGWRAREGYREFLLLGLGRPCFVWGLGRLGARIIKLYGCGERTGLHLVASVDGLHADHVGCEACHSLVATLAATSSMRVVRTDSINMWFVQCACEELRHKMMHGKGSELPSIKPYSGSKFT